ncbi:Uncharacterized protein PCOAH_00047230 [Plasmodium coatneyi]|uniref:Core Histone H2A/H2B/H3 domain-containing protein n=1 Tax=Plasmodium coatneyi TaxID=208452 RepID=A0A1B1E3C2_9APIC|nr:Uncharacterized protein PCOAH_00047230 [Plasmodium coatneyi]ANQ09457.1 Uncharacterized protein PCOAH_00047230 [Plasmodium coatneyi]
MNVKNDKDDEVETFWRNQLDEISNMGTEDLKTHNLPISRIKKIMKEDDEIKSNQMISADTPVLLAKACELFIMEMTKNAWKYTEESKRRTLQRQDVICAACKRDIFDFLIDTIPIEERIKLNNLNAKENSKKNNNSSSSSGNGSGDGSQGGGNDSGGNDSRDNQDLDHNKVDFDTLKQYYNMYSSACDDKDSVNLQEFNDELIEIVELVEKELHAANALTPESGTAVNLAKLREVAKELVASLNALYKNSKPVNASRPPNNQAVDFANNLFFCFNQNSHLKGENSSSNSNDGQCIYNTKGSDETHLNSLSSSGNQYTQGNGITKYNTRRSCSSNNQGSTSEYFANNNVNANHANLKCYSCVKDNMARQGKQKYGKNMLNESGDSYQEMDTSKHANKHANKRANKRANKHASMPASRTVNIPSTSQNRDLVPGIIPSYQELEELKNKYLNAMKTMNLPKISDILNMSNLSNASNENGHTSDKNCNGNILLNPNLYLTSLTSLYNGMSSTQCALAQHNSVNNSEMRKPKVGANKRTVQVQQVKDANTRGANTKNAYPNNRRQQSRKSDVKSSDNMNPQQNYLNNCHPPDVTKRGPT